MGSKRRRLDQDVPGVRQFRVQALLYVVRHLVSLGDRHDRWQVDHDPHLHLTTESSNAEVAYTPHGGNAAHNAQNLAGQFLVVLVHQPRNRITRRLDSDADD